MRVRGRKRRRRGAAMVEAALVLGLVFIPVILCLIDASRLGMVAQLVAGAAREGCRVAVLPGSTQADVQSRVDAFLNGSGISAGTVTPTTTATKAWYAVKSTDNPNTIQVEISVPFNQASWFGTPYIFGATPITASATFSSERP